MPVQIIHDGVALTNRFPETFWRESFPQAAASTTCSTPWSSQ